MGRDPKAEVEISAHSRNLGARLREARAKFSNFGGELKKHVFGKDLVEKGFWSKGGAQLVGNLATRGVTAIGGVLADQAASIYDFERGLTRLGIAADKTPAEMRAFANSVTAASNATGLGRNNILGAARAYVALTGDMDGAARATTTWARVAQATDSNIEDVARTAASLKQNLKIDPRDMEAAFSALAIQGKLGAIELKDLASQLSNIAPQWAMFKGGSGVQGLKEMGAALQVVKQGFGGDAGETVTGLQSLLNAVQHHSNKFGLKNVFDIDAKGVRTPKNVLEIVDAISKSELVKNPKKMIEAFGRVEAYRAYLQLAQNKQLLGELIAKSGDTKVIGRDLDKYLASPAGRIESAWTNAKNTIAEAFTPGRIEAFASAVEHLIPMIGSLGSGIGDIALALGEVGRSIDLGAGKKSVDLLDKLALSADNPVARRMLSGALGHDVTDAELANRQAAARRNVGNVEGFNAAVDTIETAAGGAGKSNVEGARAAIGAKYSGNTGAAQAGAAYLQNTGQQDPIEVAMRAMAAITQAGQDAQAKAIARELGNVLRPLLQTPIAVKVDGAKIVDATRNSSSHARRPGG